MNLFNTNKKGQSLPLNTVVIAILVIIVLLVIIVFFVLKFGEEGSKTEGLTECDIDNPTISGMGYATAGPVKGTSCSSGSRIYQVTTEDGYVCCGTKSTDATGNNDDDATSKK